MSEVCLSDGSFGPSVGSCRGGFDFTLTFEDSMLNLLPQVLLLLLAPIRLLTLSRRSNRVAKKSHLGFLKLIATALYTASATLIFVVWCETNDYKTKVSVAAACFEFLSSLCIAFLSQMEHTRAVRPSHLLQFFLTVLLACDAVRLRTLFLMNYDSIFVASLSVHTFLTGALLLLESLDKRDLLFSERDKTLSPEETIGLFGEYLFWYLNDLFKQGYRRVLQPKDLHKIDQNLVSHDLRERFQRAWELNSNKTKPRALMRVIASVLTMDLLLPIVPRLLYMGTTLSQPFLISALLNFVDAPVNAHTTNNGYGLIAAFGLNYLFLAVFSSWYSQAVARFAVKLRGVLVFVIYQKALEMKAHDVNLGSATVLMNVDVEKIIEGTKMMHEFWAIAVSSAIGLYILWTKLGAAFVAPMVVAVLSMAVSSGIGGRVKLRQMDWVKATEKRVTTIAYAAGCMKGIRMLGLVETMHELLTELRIKEVAAHRYVRKTTNVVLVVSNVLFQMALFATYITFAIIAIYNNTAIDLEVLISSLSALKIVTSPMLSTLQQIPLFQSAVASVERIQMFLCNGELNPIEDPWTDEPETTLELQCLDFRQSRPSETAFSVTGGTFAIEASHPILRNINLQVPSGSLTCLIGRVASGKSVLLHSLIGETTLVAGQFHPPQSGIAFCAQNPWLRNATLKANILGESDFDQDWYDTIVWACGLQSDFAEFKRGDSTMVGSKGISLSGGQKNRISLARALYSKKPIMVIDDILSGLDAKTESLVFMRVFGRSGLLRRSGVTVVLATHSTHWAAEFDKLVVLSEGRVVADGPYAELAALPGFLEKHSLHEGSKERKEDSDPEGALQKLLPGPVDSVAAAEEEDATRRSGDARTLWYYLSAIGLKHVLIQTSTMIISIAAATIQYIWIKQLSNSNTASAAFKLNIAIFSVITVLDIALTAVWLTHFTMYFCPRSSLSLHAPQLAAFMHARFSHLVATDIGSITNRFSQDVVLVDRELSSAYLNTTATFVEQVANFAIIVIATPPIAALLPVLVSAAYFIQRVYLRTSRQIRLMDLEAKAPLCTHFLETLAGIATVRAFGWAETYRRRNVALLDDSQRPFYLLYAVQNWLNLVLELLVAGVVIILVGLAVGLKGKVDAAYLGLALVGAMDLGAYTRQLITSWTNLETALSAVSRIRTFATETPQEHSLDPLASTTIPATWPTHGSMTIKHLTASYAPTSGPVLKDISLTVSSGEKIGICGRTASGKSSLVATLFGLLERRGGTIEIGGLDIENVPLERLRRSFVAVPQEPVFLPGTIGGNLDPWKEGDGDRVSEEQMLDALKEVGLLEKFESVAREGGSVVELPMDGDGGVDALLSQGERQLFCLARAGLQRGRIVVLDEATSSVDLKTDELMQRVLRSRFQGRTVIAIAHRLSTILDFDRVVVIEKGEIVEVGAPAVLLGMLGSKFRALVESH